MAVMMGNLYRALKDGGASDDVALKAAEEFADFNRQVTDIKGEFMGVKLEFERIRTELAIIKTMLGIVIAGVVAIIVKTFLG
jgi:hypothetical protein